MRSYSAEETYTLADLEDWQFEGNSLAVLGHPVRHSISPQMHNAALAALAANRPDLADWRYFRFDIEPEALVESLPIFHQKGFVGLNLTVPHKEVAFHAIGSIDPSARNIGAVNTLRKEEAGYHGFNTDGYGLSQGIKTELGCELNGSHIILVGAGGAARAAAIQCILEACASLTIVNRNPDRLSRLMSELRSLAVQFRPDLRSAAPNALPPFPESSIIINATSLGLKPEDPLPLPAQEIPEAARCFDMIYNPPVTAFMKMAIERKGKAANGLSMLVHQGAKSLEIWTQSTAPVAVMEEAALKALAP